MFITTHVVLDDVPRPLVELPPPREQNVLKLKNKKAFSIYMIVVRFLQWADLKFSFSSIVLSKHVFVLYAID